MVTLGVKQRILNIIESRHYLAILIGLSCNKALSLAIAPLR
jgi:hypothetical protein